MHIHGVLNGGIHPAVRKSDDGLATRDGAKQEALRDASGKRTTVFDVEEDDRAGRQRGCILTAANRLQGDLNALTYLCTDAAIALPGIEGDDRVAVTSERAREGESACHDPECPGASTC